MFDELMKKKLALYEEVQVAICHDQLPKLAGQTIYFIDPWDLLPPEGSESDLVEKLQFHDGLAMLYSEQGSQVMVNLDLDNSLSLLHELEQGNYQTKPLEDEEDAEDQAQRYDDGN